MRLNKSILAGILIGLGCWMFLSVDNSIVGAILFSCGLLTIRLLKLNLYTGKVQYILQLKISFLDYIIFLIGNLIGILIVFLICEKTLSINKLIEISNIKSSQTFIQAIIKGIGCGILMSIATYKDTPLWITSLCVIAFILCGFNHCIADFFYMLSNFHYNWFGTLIGNTLGGLIFSSYYLIKDEQ